MNGQRRVSSSRPCLSLIQENVDIPGYKNNLVYGNRRVLDSGRRSLVVVMATMTMQAHGINHEAISPSFARTIRKFPKI